MHIRFLDHGHQSFLRPPSRLEQAGKVRPLPEFGDPEIHRAHPGFPLTGSIPIAVGGALIRTLVPIGTHFSAHFELHQGLAENRDGFSKKVGIMHSVLAQKLFKCDAKIGHFRVLLCDVLVLQRMEPESDLFCQDHPLFTPLLGTLTLFHDGGVVAVSLFLFAVYYMFKDINARCGKKERFWIYFILIGLVFINLTDSSKFVSSPKESWVMLWFPMVFIAAWMSSKESFQKAEAGQEQVSQTCARRIQKTI